MDCNAFFLFFGFGRKLFNFIFCSKNTLSTCPMRIHTLIFWRKTSVCLCLYLFKRNNFEHNCLVLLFLSPGWTNNLKKFDTGLISVCIVFWLYLKEIILNTILPQWTVLETSQVEPSLVELELSSFIKWAKNLSLSLNKLSSVMC